MRSTGGMPANEAIGEFIEHLADRGVRGKHPAPARRGAVACAARHCT
jgi:hypothetical protein